MTELLNSTAVITDIPEVGYLFIKGQEGRALKAYRDSAGVWTIGFGITNYDSWAVAYLGKAIGAGMVITETQADYLLRESIKRQYLPRVLKAMPTANINAVTGATSFDFNTGAITRATWVSLWKAKATDAAIRASLGSWNKAGGKVLLGLTRRRAREADIILLGKYGDLPTPAALNEAGQIIPVPVTNDAHELARTPGMSRLDDIGPQITDLNASLAALGYKTTGDHFNMATDAAVRSFQKAHPQLTLDGVVGPATRAAIKREMDMRGSMTKVSSVGGTAAAVAAVGDVASSGGVPLSVFVAMAVAFAVLIGVVIYRYRDELTGIANQK